ncbi:CBS domain-containing protein [Fibrobacterota bacterium]
MIIKKVRDLMIPAEQYPTVHRNDSLLDMILVLEKSQASVPEGHYKLRSVLVTDKRGHIIGKIGHLQFLKALEPKYSRMTDFDKLSAVGLSSDFLEAMMENMRLWDDALWEVGAMARHIKVGDVMHPISESLDEDASVMDAVHKIIMWQALSLTVTRGGKIVGVVRQADLYREIADHVKKSCGVG